MKVITIGRSEENDVVINDETVSRHHLQIIFHDDGHYTLSDFGSTNGTYVNGQRISGEIPLDDVDIVRIGNKTIPWRQYFEEERQPVPKNNIPPQVETAPASSNLRMPENKERHGLVTFWLWLMIIANAVGIIMQAMSANYAIWAYATPENAKLFFYVKHGMVSYYTFAAYFMIVLSMVNIASASLLLKWKKFGYWMFVGSAAACFAIMISFGVLGGVTISVVGSMVGAFIGPTILWAILQIKKNGARCWKQLE